MADAFTESFSGELTEVMRSTEQSVCSSLRNGSMTVLEPARMPNSSSTARICPDFVEHSRANVCFELVLSVVVLVCRLVSLSSRFH